MDIWTTVAAAIAGYLFGSVSFTRILGRWVLPGDDLSGVEVDLGGGTLRFDRTSASLISMKRGPGYGCLTGLLDMAKAAIPVLFFKLAFPAEGYDFVAAALAVVGHNYPVFHRFRGGAGMSPYLGGLAVLDWLAVPIVTGLGVLTGLAVRNVVLSYSAGVIWLLPWFWWRNGDWPAIAYAGVVNIAVWTALAPVVSDLTRMQRSGEIDRREAMRMLRAGHPSLDRDKYQSD